MLLSGLYQTWLIPSQLLATNLSTSAKTKTVVFLFPLHRPAPSFSSVCQTLPNAPPPPWQASTSSSSTTGAALPRSYSTVSLVAGVSPRMLLCFPSPPPPVSLIATYTLDSAAPVSSGALIFSSSDSLGPSTVARHVPPFNQGSHFDWSQNFLL